MKTITTLILFIAIAIGSYGQNSTIAYYDWSNPKVFIMSPSPKVTGYGYYSDSLSKVYEGKTFYVHNYEYYVIESWADYYLWFTKKYSHLFTGPAEYEYFYLADDDFGMASYIASNKYEGKFYPSSIVVDFKDAKIERNRLSSNKRFVETNKEKALLDKELNQPKNKKDFSEREIMHPTNERVFNESNYSKKVNRSDQESHPKQMNIEKDKSKINNDSKERVLEKR